MKKIFKQLIFRELTWKTRLKFYDNVVNNKEMFNYIDGGGGTEGVMFFKFDDEKEAEQVCQFMKNNINRTKSYKASTDTDGNVVVKNSTKFDKLGLL